MGTARFLLLPRSNSEVALFQERLVANRGDAEAISRNISGQASPGRAVELDEQQLADVEADPSVEAVLSMPFVLPKTIEASEDASIAELTSERNDGTRTAWGIAAVGADGDNTGGAGVSVAVLDTGIEASHKAFEGIRDNLEFRDFTTDPSGAMVPPSDGDPGGHGTHVAGTIFGRDVDGTTIGVARSVNRVLVANVLLGGPHGGTTESLRNGIFWAISSGANIISMSLGIDVFAMKERLLQNGFEPEVADSMALKGHRDNVRLFDSLAEMALLGRSTLIFAATGNESQRERAPDYLIEKSIPAASQNILPIAAVGRGTSKAVPYKVADFSNTGPEFAAPGVDILSAGIGSSSKLTLKSGTSMATPHAAGVACLYGALTERTQPNWADQTLQRLREGLNHIPGRFRDIGHGMVLWQ